MSAPVLDHIHSELWKSSDLMESAHFPRMVRQAAREAGATYTLDLLEDVATDPALLAAVELPRGEGMDAALSQMASDPQKASELDGLIVAAVYASTTTQEA